MKGPIEDLEKNRGEELWQNNCHKVITNVWRDHKRCLDDHITFIKVII